MSLPEVIEELWLKPVIWLVPLMLWNFSIKDRVAIFDKSGWFSSVVFGLLVGSFYVFTLGGFRFAGLNVDANYFGIALSVAIVEEVVFSGFVFSLLSRVVKPKTKALVLASVMAVGSHLPIMLFSYSMNLWETLPSLLLVFGYSLINILISASTKNVLGSIIARLMLILAIA